MAVFSSATPATPIELILNIAQISMSWGPLTHEWEVRIQPLMSQQEIEWVGLVAVFLPPVNFLNIQTPKKFGVITLKF